MDDSEHGQYADQPSTQLTLTRPTKSPLSRRTFISWLDLTASLGLGSVAVSACGSEAASQQDDSQQEEAGGRGASEEDGGTANQQDDSQQEQAAGTNASEDDGGTVGLGCIGIFVRDLPASLSFYRRLGLAIPENAGGGYDYRLPLPTGQVFFWETYQAVRAFDPDWQPSSGNRRVVLEFGFANAQALNDKYAELTSEGYEGYLDPFTFSNSTIRYALIRDPDGNEIALRYPRC